MRGRTLPYRALAFKIKRGSFVFDMPQGSPYGGGL